MSCFKLPKSIIVKLNSAISNFWWSSSDNSRGVHWLKWRSLCKPKSKGGLGFRALEEFNTALLAKQLWKLIDVPDSLFSRIFKGRYFKNSSPMCVSKNHSPSYGWRSIISARALLNKGLIKRVGNGHSISVWRDPWIPDVVPRPAKGFEPWLFPNLTVDQFIDPNTNSWREVPLRQYLVPEDVQLVLGIRIASSRRPDRWGWHFTKSGHYSVKSGYKIEDEYLLNVRGMSGPNINDLQANAWKLKCPGKIKNFIWQAISGCVAVKDKLRSRGIRCDNSCVRCGDEGESINHVLFECPPARQTWALSNISSPITFPGLSLWANLDYLFWRIPDQKDNIVFPWILWKSRNDKLFKGLDKDPRDILRLSEMEADEWLKANSPSFYDTTIRTKEGSSLWKDVAFPLVGNMAFTGYRCYVDAAWKPGDLFSGMAWCCFSDSSEVPSFGGQAVPRSLSACHAEFEAVLWSMECLISLGIAEVEMGTDCSDVVRMISNPEEWPAFASYIEDLVRLKSFFSSFSINVIPRCLNHCADGLARSFRG